jgi:hypothetical protein
MRSQAFELPQVESSGWCGMRLQAFELSQWLVGGMRSQAFGLWLVRHVLIVRFVAEKKGSGLAAQDTFMATLR